MRVSQSRMVLGATLLIIGAGFASAACSSSSSSGSDPVPDADSGTPSDPKAGGDGGSSTPTLACQQLTWCTNYEPTSAPATSPPALNGGAIAEGFYRSEEGGSAVGLLFQGSQVLQAMPGVGASNLLGSWAASGPNLTITYATECSYGKADRASTKTDAAFTYAADGTSLFLKSPTAFGNSDVRRFQLIARPSDVCRADAHFKCDSSVCSCSIQTGTTLEKCP